MYIFELVAKYIKGKKYNITSNYAPNNSDDIIENPLECKHLFQPLDSSKQYFGCKFCGLVVHRDKLK